MISQGLAVPVKADSSPDRVAVAANVLPSLLLVCLSETVTALSWMLREAIGGGRRRLRAKELTVA
jgi:hypothetical protein